MAIKTSRTRRTVIIRVAPSQCFAENVATHAIETQVAMRRNPCIRVRFGGASGYDERVMILGAETHAEQKTVTAYGIAISVVYGPERNAMRKYIENGM
jgi:hypothetical protein